MLNLNTALANAPLPTLTTACPTPATAPGAGDGPAFTKELNQAAARQREAAGDGAAASSGDARETEATPGAHAGAADARPAQAPRSAPKGRAPAGADAGAAAPSQAVSADTAEAASALPAADTSGAIAPADEVPPQPADLAAWMSNLALPRPAAAALATPAGVKAEPIVHAAQARATDAANAAAQAPPPLRPGDDSSTLPPGLQAGDRVDLARHAEAPGARTAVRAPADAAERGRSIGAGKAVEAGGNLGLGLAAGLGAAPQAQHGPGERPSAQRPGGDSGNAVVALLGAALAARPPEAPTAVQAELKAPVGSSEFAPMLGAQLSVMVRDGIGHAQLKLNPAEMGPIDVRISLDGSSAQVDFSAAHAATRQALQDAVPALAGALRESGLTLTGGGVFEQAREQRGDARQQSAGHAAGTPGRAVDGGALDSRAASVAAARAPRARGVVDLYA